jgi:hypothetical protein
VLVGNVSDAEIDLEEALIAHIRAVSDHTARNGFHSRSVRAGKGIGPEDDGSRPPLADLAQKLICMSLGVAETSSEL